MSEVLCLLAIATCVCVGGSCGSLLRCLSSEVSSFLATVLGAVACRGRRDPFANHSTRFCWVSELAIQDVSHSFAVVQNRVTWVPLLRHMGPVDL